IALELRARESERILRIRLVQAIRHHRDLAHLELCVEMLARHRAVIAIAVGLEARHVADGIDATALATELERAAPRLVATQQETRLAGRHSRPVHRLDRDP